MHSLKLPLLNHIFNTWMMFEMLTVSSCCSLFATIDILLLTWGLNQLSCSFNDAVHFLNDRKRYVHCCLLAMKNSTNLNLLFVTFIVASAVILSSSSWNVGAQEMWSLMESSCNVWSGVHVCSKIKHKTAHCHILIKLKPTWVTARWFQFFPSRPMHEYRQKRKRGHANRTEGWKIRKNKNGAQVREKTLDQ